MNFCDSIKLIFADVTSTTNGTATTAATMTSLNDPSTNKVPKPETNSHQRIPSRTDKLNNSLGLNLSMHQSCDISFDMKEGIETLGKNIGNLSMINNSKLGDNVNMSQLEMDEMILKSMLENPEKARSLKEYSNSQNVYLNSQNGHPSALNYKKTNQTLSTNENKAQEQKKVLADNTNYQHQRRASYSKTQPAYDVVESNNKHYSKDASFNKENYQEYDNREQKGQPLIKSNSGLNRSIELDAQKNHQHADSRTKQKCNCGTAEELAKALAKIESMEKKMKALTEENKAIFDISNYS